MKTCIKCNHPKPEVEFPRSKINKDGLYSYCKVCVNAMHKKDYQSHHEAWKSTRKHYYNTHRDHLLKKQVERLQNPTTRKMRNETSAKRDRWRRKHDSLYRIKRTIRTRVWNALKGIYKCKHTEELLGCSFSELKQKLESKFSNGMSWDNYGKWHVDHIIPCNAFNLIKESEQKKCFHHTNLQPLWAVDNLRKNCKRGQ